MTVDALSAHTRVQLADIESEWRHAPEDAPMDVIRNAARLTLLVRALNYAQETIPTGRLVAKDAYALVFKAAELGDPEARMLTRMDQAPDGR